MLKSKAVLTSSVLRIKENTVLNRLHIGHSSLTHSFILKKKKSLLFVLHVILTSQSNIIVLIECADLVEVRQLFYFLFLRMDIFLFTFSERERREKTSAFHFFYIFFFYSSCLPPCYKPR